MFNQRVRRAVIAAPVAWLDPMMGVTVTTVQGIKVLIRRRPNQMPRPSRRERGGRRCLKLRQMMPTKDKLILLNSLAWWTPSMPFRGLQVCIRIYMFMEHRKKEIILTGVLYWILNVMNSLHQVLTLYIIILSTWICFRVDEFLIYINQSQKYSSDFFL